MGQRLGHVGQDSPFTIRTPFDDLEMCDEPQSPLTLVELAEKHKPSKFFRYAHTDYQRFY